MRRAYESGPAGRIGSFFVALAMMLLVLPVAVGATPRQSDPRSIALARMHKQVTVEIDGNRLEDVITFVEEYTGVTIEAMWANDRFVDGLDPDRSVGVRIRNGTALALLDGVLGTLDDEFVQHTWQVSGEGTIQIGTKEQLNRFATLRMYDVRDLLFVVPSFREVPDLDLGSIQQGGGGGGAQTTFDKEETDKLTQDEMAERLMDIIVNAIEPDQWDVNGGTGASVRFHSGMLLVRAADYVHRQLGGYDFWPSDAMIRRYSRNN
ncbi:MAG: hypothetical protein ACF8GE_03420 [Phycisphaerales bacterium JB043]